jgi:hypothetical protein
LVSNPEVKKHIYDLGTDGRIVLKGIFASEGGDWNELAQERAL